MSRKWSAVRTWAISHERHDANSLTFAAAVCSNLPGGRNSACQHRWPPPLAGGRCLCVTDYRIESSDVSSVPPGRPPTIWHAVCSYIAAAAAVTTLRVWFLRAVRLTGTEKAYGPPRADLLERVFCNRRRHTSCAAASRAARPFRIVLSPRGNSHGSRQSEESSLCCGRRSG